MTAPSAIHITSSQLTWLAATQWVQAHTHVVRWEAAPFAPYMAGDDDDLFQEAIIAAFKALMEVQNQISLENNEKLLGQCVEVMVEGPSRTDESVWTGRTRTNKIVLWDKGAWEKEGDLGEIKVTHPQTWVLKGELQDR